MGAIFEINVAQRLSIAVLHDKVAVQLDQGSAQSDRLTLVLLIADTDAI
jgi:hypothetical protein